MLEHADRVAPLLQGTLPRDEAKLQLHSSESQLRLTRKSAHQRLLWRTGLLLATPRAPCLWTLESGCWWKGKRLAECGERGSSFASTRASAEPAPSSLTVKYRKQENRLSIYTEHRSIRAARCHRGGASRDKTKVGPISPRPYRERERRTCATYAGCEKANGPVICINIVRLCRLCKQAGTYPSEPVKMSTALQYCSLVAPINSTAADPRFTISFRGWDCFFLKKKTRR